MTLYVKTAPFIIIVKYLDYLVRTLRLNLAMIHPMQLANATFFFTCHLDNSVKSKI